MLVVVLSEARGREEVVSCGWEVAGVVLRSRLLGGAFELGATVEEFLGQIEGGFGS